MTRPKIYNKRCPYCNKTFSSLSEAQIEFNYYSHIGACKKKIVRQANIEAKNERLSQIPKEKRGKKRGDIKK